MSEKDIKAKQFYCQPQSVLIRRILRFANHQKDQIFLLEKINLKSSFEKFLTFNFSILTLFVLVVVATDIKFKYI